MLQEGVMFIAFAAIAFSAVYIMKRFNERNKIQGIDVNKKNKPLIPESTGIALLFPLLIGVGMLLQLYKQLDLLSWIALISFFGGIGFLDDWFKAQHKHMSWLMRAIPIGFVALLFASVYAWNAVMVVPLALFIAGLASFQNTFAGLNGLEIGSGFLISLFQVTVLWGTELKWIALIVSASILGLLAWNVYPAKVFPGDSGTLLIGAAIAGVFVFTNNSTLVLFGFLLFFPHMIDFLLKLFSNRSDATQKKILPYALTKDNKIAIPKKQKTLDLMKVVLKITGPQKESVLVAIGWIIVFLNGLFWRYLLLGF